MKSCFVPLSFNEKQWWQGTDLSFFKNYTIKQWNTDPKNLHPSVTARIPFRYNTDDKYFNDKTPWRTINNDKETCATTINLCLQTIKTLSVLFEPAIPFSARKMRRILNLSLLEVGNEWDICGDLSLKAGHKLNVPEILFQKIDDAAIEPEIKKLKIALDNKTEHRVDMEKKL